MVIQMNGNGNGNESEFFTALKVDQKWETTSLL